MIPIIHYHLGISYQIMYDSGLDLVSKIHEANPWGYTTSLFELSVTHQLAVRDNRYGQLLHGEWAPTSSHQHYL